MLWTSEPSQFLNMTEMELHGCMVNKPERCHFEFAKVVLCSWADSNTMKKVKIRVNIAKQ